MEKHISIKIFKNTYNYLMVVSYNRCLLIIVDIKGKKYEERGVYSIDTVIQLTHILIQTLFNNLLNQI